LPEWQVPGKTATTIPLQQQRSDAAKSYSQIGHFENSKHRRHVRNVLLVAELGANTDMAVTTRNDDCSIWAQQWAQKTMGQQVFSAVYALELQSISLANPTSHKDKEYDHNYDPSSDPQWRKLLQHTLEQPMILKRIGDSHIIPYTMDELVNIDTPSQAPREMSSDEMLVLSHSCEVHDVLREPMLHHAAFGAETERCPEGCSDFMTILNKDAILSSMACASVILRNDQVNGHKEDCFCWDTLVELYRKLVQHALRLNKAKEQTSSRRNDELESSLDCLGRFSLVLLQTGQQVLLIKHEQQTLQDQTESMDCGSSLIRGFQESDEHHADPSLSLQEYFAARFLASNILRADDMKSLDFVFSQDMAARHDVMLAHVAVEASRRHGLDGMRALIALCRQNKARDVIGAYQLRLELRLLHAWMTTTTNKGRLEDGLARLEADFHILENFQQWFKVGVAHLRRTRAQESSRSLLNFLVDGLKNFSIIPERVSGCVDTLLQACTDENKSVRQVAIDTICQVAKLGLRFNADQVSVIIGLCKTDECENVRNAATKALAEVVKAVPNLATQCRPVILDACKDKRSLVRKEASNVLAQIAVANPLQCLATISFACRSDRNGFVRAAAALALGNVAKTTPGHAEKCMSTLMEACKLDRDGNVRKSATSAVAEVALSNTKLAAKCLRLISELCKKDESERVRQAATVAIAKLLRASPRFGFRCLSTLSDACKDESKCVRKDAAWALGYVAESTPDLATKYHCLLSDVCTEDGNESVRRAAVLALADVATATPGMAAKCYQTLVSVAMCDTAEMVRKAAVHALGQVATSNVEIAPKCLKTLVDTCLEDKHPDVRKAAARAVGLHVELSEHFVPILWKARQESDCPFRRSAAASALLEIVKGRQMDEANPSIDDCLPFSLDGDIENDVECEAGEDGTNTVMRKLVPHPDLAMQCISILLDAFNEKAESHDDRKVATYFLGEVACIDHAKKGCLTLLLKLAEEDHNNCSHSKAAIGAIRSLSIEKLISGYWSTQHDGLLPFIAEQYFSTPFFTFTNSRDQLCLVLYNTAGRRIEFEENESQIVHELVSKMAFYFQQSVEDLKI
jgi:HEAT repeat protein